MLEPPNIEHKNPKLIIFASGSKTGGGSGFENLVTASRDGRLTADIVAVVSNHEHGGVRERADRLGIRFIHLPIQSPKTDEELPANSAAYQKIVAETGAEWIALSGWLKLVTGLDPRRTFNIHPGLLPLTAGTHGIGTHAAALAAYARKEITHTAVTMHFISETRGIEDYDRGPIFFQHLVPIEATDTPEVLATRVNAAEHKYQPKLTSQIIHGLISWDGQNPSSLEFPPKSRPKYLEELEVAA